jgi:hypothetical protein
MATIFPNNPQVNDEYTSSGKTWKWDGTSWGLLPLTTTDIVEGTELYFTNQRAVNAGSTTYLTQTSASTTYLTQTSASTLYRLPTQTGNSGKYLSTNGASASWVTATIPDEMPHLFIGMGG